MPTFVNPVGVSGTTLETKGEIQLKLEISSDKKYSGMFVIIENLVHDLILGLPALQELQFSLTADDTRVQLAETSIPRTSSIFSIAPAYPPD